jgi:hypothetical protein
MDDPESKPSAEDSGVTRSHPLPPAELARYSSERDIHTEQDIARYVELEVPDENIQHLEKLKQEFVVGEIFEIWDVVTDKDRWWVITNLTNLYSQKHFPSLDYTLSFHVGLMMRLRSRPDGADAEEPTPFDEVFRRQEQAKHRFDRAVESEDYQAVGMQLRECLISLVGALRRRVDLKSDLERPHDADFVAWSALLMDELCSGSGNKELRHYLKNAARDAWQLVNWLTHERNANKTATFIAIQGCDLVVGNFVQILEREKADKVDHCPLCTSRNLRTHYDPAIAPDGDYYMTCGACEWSNRPNAG